MLPDTVPKMPFYICLYNFVRYHGNFWALLGQVNMIMHDSHLFTYPSTTVMAMAMKKAYTLVVFIVVDPVVYTIIL